MSNSIQALAIVERYDQCVNYLYPIIQNMPRKHGQYRDRILAVLLRIPGEMYLAAKSNQVGKVNAVDGSLAELRWLLRFAAAGQRRLITQHQQAVATVHLAETGRMVGAWAKKLKR